MSRFLSVWLRPLLSPPTFCRPHPGGCLAALALLWVTLALTGVTGCGVAPEAPIQVWGGPDSPRFQQVLASLRAGLAPRPLEVTLYSEGEGDGADQLRLVRGRRPRLLIVLGTPALIITAPAEKKIPIVFTMVANPYFTGAAYDPQRPEVHQRNVTGIASPPPVAAALEQGARLLGQRPWGLIYDPLDGASLEIKAKFESLAPTFGLTPLTEAATDAGEDREALDRLVRQGAKVLYLPPTATAGRFGPLLLEMGRRRQIMVVSGHPELPGEGAILRVAIDYRRLGEETAALAKRLLAGQQPAEIPLTEQIPLAISVDESLLNFWSGYPPVRR